MFSRFCSTFDFGSKDQMLRFIANGIILLLIGTPCFVAQESVRLPPNIVKQPLKDIIIRGQEPVTLECQAEGTPKISYTWKKNGIDLNENVTNINRSNDGTIVISSATILDEGYYQCFAENQYGTALSNTFQVRKAVVGTGSQHLHHRTVKEGEPFHIPADLIKSYPSPSYEWAIANNVVDQYPQPVQLSERVKIADNGDLYFAYAKSEDDLKGKIYKSLTYNPSLDVKVGGGYTNITVTRGLTGILTNFPPRLGFASENQTVAVFNTSVTLRCFFYGNPVPTIKWKDPKDNEVREGSQSKYKLGKHNTDLTITDIKESDEGVYVCTGSNSENEPGLKHSIQLLVEKAPVFKHVANGPHNVNVTEGRSFTFHCKADAKPDAEIVWLRNGKEIKKEPTRYLFSADKKSLTIANLCLKCEDQDTTDITVIQCNASNKHGHAFSSGYLNIFRNTKITTHPVQSNDTNESNEAVLGCSASHDPSTPVKWRWYRLNRYGNDSKFEEIKEIFGSRLIRLIKGILRIKVDRKNSTKEDIRDKFYGTYMCVAETEISSVNKTIEFIQPTPPPTTTPSCVFVSFEPFWLCYVIYAAIGLFVILLFFICICCLCYNYRHNEEYDVDAKEHWTGSNPEKELMAFGFHEAYRVETISRTLKSSKASLSSATLLRIDEEDNMNDYGDDMGKFNEDGSFVGTYRSQSRGGFM